MADLSLVFNPPENATTLVQKILYINTLTDVGMGGMLGIGILIVVGAIFFLMAKAFAFEKAFPVTMIITSFMGILLGIFGLVSSRIIYICIILLVISLFILFRERDVGY